MLVVTVLLVILFVINNTAKFLFSAFEVPIKEKIINTISILFSINIDRIVIYVFGSEFLVERKLLDLDLLPLG